MLCENREEGRILPRIIIASTKYNCINIHYIKCYKKQGMMLTDLAKINI